MNLHKWEVVENQSYGTATFRMGVPGGWLYRYGSSSDSCIVFVPEVTV